VQVILTTDAAHPPRGESLRGHLIDTLRVGVPLVFAQLALMGQGVIDALLAGRLDAQILASVAIGVAIWGFLMILNFGVQSALAPTLAQLRGAGRLDEIRPAARQALWTAVLVMLILLLLAQATPWILRAFELSDTLRRGAQDFMDGVLWGVPALCLFSLLRTYCEGMGYTRPSLYFAVLGLLLLGPIGYVLMYGKLGFPRMEAYGSGLATAIVLWIEALAFFWYVQRHPQLGREDVFLGLDRPDAARIGALLKLGLPIALGWAAEAGLFQVSALLVGGLGDAPTAAHQVAINVASLTFMVPLGLAMAVTVRVGHARGAGDALGVRRAAQAGVLIALVSQVLSALLMLVFASWIAALYLPNDPTVATMAVGLLMLAAIFQFPDGVQVVCAGALRGLKDTAIPSMITVIAYWVLAFPMAWWLAYHGGMGVHGLWIGFIIGLSAAAVLLGTRLWILQRRLALL
jgi:MATE family multidrug resistance protein